MLLDSGMVVPATFTGVNTPKLVFGQGSALEPSGGAYDAPADPLAC